MAILDRIKFDGPVDNSSWVVYKAPEEDITLGSQLVVGQGQEAIFVKGGKVCDLFTSGTYTLSSGNLPLLGKIIKLPFGGKTPFAAEVYYVNRTANLGMKWGTTAPMSVEDPKYGLLLNLRAFGKYGVRIQDAKLFISQLVGSIRLDSGYNHEFVAEQFISLINTKLKSFLMGFLRRKKISFLDLAEYYEQLSLEVREKLEDDFGDYGIELINFFIEAINPPKSEYEQLRRYKEELALGEGFYDKRRSFDILEGLAGSSIGGIVAAGIGMGAGSEKSALNSAMDVIGGNIKNKNSAASSAASPALAICKTCGKEIGNDSAFCPYCGSKVEKLKLCPKCGREVPGNARFCSYCGASLAERFCEQCGNKLAQDATFCSNCGKRC